LIASTLGLALSILASAVSAAPAPVPSSGLVSPEEQKAADTITAPLLSAHIQFLASDLLEGRGPATRGDRLALEYVATELASMGFQPAAPEGGWIQKVPLVQITPKTPDPMAFSSGGKKVELQGRADFVAFPGIAKPDVRIEDAELVFVGYGIVAPEFQWDDYKDADLRGKVLVMMNNDPENDPKLFAGTTRLRYGRWDYKYEMAGKKGAAGALLIHTTHSAGYPWQVVQTSWSGSKYELPYEGEPRVQVKGWMTEDASRKVVALGGQDLDRLRASAERRDFRPVPLGVRLSYAMTSEIRQVESGNVIGKLPGSDPALANQAVLYTAHHDHLGIKPGLPSGADAICNGAVDNASGVAAMLAIAKAFAALPKAPRRSIYFASVTAEEQGLLGSEYLSKHSPIPTGRIAANINIDGINIFGRTKDLTMIGFGKSNLDDTIVALAAVQGRVVKPDQFPDRGSFYRSDQFNLARAGVPAAYFAEGTDFVGRPAGWGKEQIEKWEATHYHQPSDEFHADWDLSGAVEDVRLDFFLGVNVANQDALPGWKPGDEFEAARKKALAELQTK
jgi:Zn-dependent M28 family amino/carboxypeptidase